MRLEPHQSVGDVYPGVLHQLSSLDVVSLVKASLDFYEHCYLLAILRCTY